MRINQFIAATSDLSRRAADAAIAAGRVTVDGRPAQTGESLADDAKVALDGRPLALRGQHTYLMVNKPTGYISSRRRQGSDPTAYELLPAEFQHLRLAGRLDRDSSGLLLLSDDGAFIQRYTHPSHQKNKLYELELDRPITPDSLTALEGGVRLDDGPSNVGIIRHDRATLVVSLQEGRNRQLRRTFGALGYTIVRLHRTQIGPYRLGNLGDGKWRVIPAGSAS